VTVRALLVFGYIKGQFTTPQPCRSVRQLSGWAATDAFVIAKANWVDDTALIQRIPIQKGRSNGN
jgi:hypothetical protein